MVYNYVTTICDYVIILIFDFKDLSSPFLYNLTGISISKASKISFKSFLLILLNL